jgi:F-type H+-transporting ATPase subunit b
MSIPLLLSTIQEHAEEGAATGPFSLEPGLIVWTWIVFIALFLVLRKWAWPAILRATEERERRIANQLAEAERLNAEAQKTREEQQRLLGEAKGEAQKLIGDARTLAERERQDLLARAREEQEQILERAKREIGAERERAIAELRREAVDLSLAAASKLIHERLTSERDRKLVSEYLASLPERH